jgi:hypothetical protein
MPLNPVVEYALESLTLVVGLSGYLDLEDPQDRAHARHHFEILRDGGEKFEPTAIIHWAASHGWHSGAARELGEIAQAVKDEKRRRISRKEVRDNVLVEWRKAAKAAPQVARSAAPLRPLGRSAPSES